MQNILRTVVKTRLNVSLKNAASFTHNHQSSLFHLCVVFGETMGVILILIFNGLFLSMGTKGIEGYTSNWLPAHATFYGASQNPTSLGGACGYDNTVHSGFGTNTAALSSALFQRGQACGACFQISCDRQSYPQWCIPRATTVTVTATNFCPPNNNGGWCDLPHHHFDMSLLAFARVAHVGSEGIVPIFYRRVPCRRSGGVRFTLKGQGSFNLVMFSNVGGSGDVRAAWIRGSPRRSSAWTAMQRNWGANWQTNTDFRNQRLSFKLMLGDGKIMEFTGVVPSTWHPGHTFAAKSQFY